jgi:hypothetical protein
MSKFRSRWLALFGGVTLIALSMSTAFAGKPAADTNRGLEVSAYVHSLVGDVEDTDTDTADETTDDNETEDDTETTDDTQVEDGESAPSDHGKCVAAVAQDPEAVGPPNDNHGGAVSDAAKVTCWDTEVESGGDSDSESGTETEDAGTSAAGPNHGKGHGGGHGKNSSDD